MTKLHFAVRVIITLPSLLLRKLRAQATARSKFPGPFVRLEDAASISRHSDIPLCGRNDVSDCKCPCGTGQHPLTGRDADG